MRRWRITLPRNPDTGRFGLGLNEGNEVTIPPAGSGLVMADVIIGCEGERLGSTRLVDQLLEHGEPTIELEARAEPDMIQPAHPCLHTYSVRATLPPSPAAHSPPAHATGPPSTLSALGAATSRLWVLL